jgi:tetratricopeptide (TPR) repeat protein
MLSDAMISAVHEICDRLTDRTATLFLGAGINYGVRNPAGELFPLAQGLSTWICRDLLEAPDLQVPLSQAAEIARYRLGDQELNRYLYEKLAQFVPSTAHLALVQLPWDVIYTTNYDLMVEVAAQAPTVEPAGRIRPIYSTQTDLAAFTEQDILYYKLHGSIDVANTTEGRLILTREDYRYYELNRKPLFKRLERDLIGHSFVFVGYGMQDPNFLDILEDCRTAVGTLSLPPSFAIRPGISEVEAAFWLEKHNIRFIDSSGDDFLNLLKDTWISQNRSIIPFETRKSKAYVIADGKARLPKVGESFYRISRADCLGQNNPELFFRGAEPSWADIRDKVPPKRDAYWTLFEAILPELAGPTLPASAYLVTGAAGTGKTTLVYSIGYDIANEFDFTVLVHIPGTPLDARVVRSVADAKDPKRIIVLIRHAAEYISWLDQFMSDAKALALPLTVIMEERKNQWAVAKTSARCRLDPPEFELGALSQEEVVSILDALEKYQALGKLTGSSRDYQVEHFTSLAHRELLVALRELTTHGSFDEIVKDEFAKIPSSKAKQAYVYVAALGQIDLAIRYETLVRVLGLRCDQLGSEVCRPTEGVLISCDELGSSRHNAGFRLSTRHPVIASVIFASEAPDDAAKFEVMNALLQHLDPGFREDRRLLEELARRRELVNTFASYEKRRALYERLLTILPNSPHVYQHRSILERDLGDAEQAVWYAREAVKLDKGNPALLNTLGLALEYAARSCSDPLKRHALLTEASRLFEDGIRRDPTDPYSYIGKLCVLRQSIEREHDADRKDCLQADALSLLEEAYEATDENPMIAGELANQRGQFGDLDEAVKIIQVGLVKDPTDNRLRDLWIRIEDERGRFGEALQIALQGATTDPTAWRMQRHIARLKRKLGESLSAVRGHYEAAIRHKKDDVGLLVELGAYLYACALYEQGDAVFKGTKALSLTSYERTRIRQRWEDDLGKACVFGGTVDEIRGACAYALAVPQNFRAFFWRNQADLRDLREGDLVRFAVGFNALGPVALRVSKQ